MKTLLNILIEFLIVVFAFIGLRSQATNGEDGKRRPDMYVYYTNLSNLAVLIFFLARTIGNLFTLQNNFTYYTIFFSHFSWYAVTLMIFVTFLVYHFLLLPAIKENPAIYGEFGQFNSFGNKSVHYIVPLLSVANWLLFESKGAVTWQYAIFWLAIPLVYAAFAFIRGALGQKIYGTNSKYPYEFMSPDLIGWEKVMVNIGVLLVGFILLGFLVLGAGWLVDFVLSGAKP